MCVQEKEEMGKTSMEATYSSFRHSAVDFLSKLLQRQDLSSWLQIQFREKPVSETST